MSEELQTNSLIEQLPLKIREEVDKVASAKKLNKAQKEKLEVEIVKAYNESRFEPGDVIGIIAAQSISEPATQMTMRTYHFAGTAGIRVTYGLPRLIEIFDAKKELETPMMTIFLKSAHNSAEGARKFAEDIVEKYVETLVDTVSLNLGDSAVEMELTNKGRNSTVVNAINEAMKDVAGAKTRGDKIVVVAKGEIDVKELTKIKEKVMNIHITGLKGVNNAVVRREGDDWIINTIGSNLESILGMKEVDSTRTVTNDIHETATVLGIEAARNLMKMEAMKTMQEQGLDVNVRHIMLLGDIMTFGGEIKSIGRYGVAGAKTSILARAAFEETIKHLVKASLRKDSDSFTGIFENVMIGQVIPSGTGMFDLISKIGEEDSEEKEE
ncbi:MAG: DNA-directed RNA polymerase subunit A'' [Candidatus Aenigmarchaeota archaeon]|nr:DNA-directed RNA polymerase subunit A'' [Candidatus Aenigmarchaeota archaeon]